MVENPLTHIKQLELLRLSCRQGAPVSASNNKATAATAAGWTPELQFRSVSNRKAAGGSRNSTREVGARLQVVACGSKLR